MKLHLDISRYDAYYRGLWREQTADWQQDLVQLVATPAQADFVVDTHGDQSIGAGLGLRAHPTSHYRVAPHRTFAWDCGDQPSGRLPGLYASLPRGRFDPRRHRSFCYSLRHNPLVTARPLPEAEFLYGFTGSVSSPLRATLFDQLQTDAAQGVALLHRTDGGALWNQMFAPGESEAKRFFAQDLGRVRFVLCPRGNGASSIRLFEALEAARVPVILSDNFVPPACVDWPSCSLTVKERDLPHLRDLLQERQADWPALATAARRTWEDCFSPANILRTIASEFIALAEARRCHERWAVAFYFPRVIPGLARYRAVCLRQNWQRWRHAERLAAADAAPRGCSGSDASPPPPC